MATGRGSICTTTFKAASSPVVPTAAGDGVCKNAVSTGTTLKQGWGVLAKETGYPLASGNSPIWGAAYCPQANDACDKNNALALKKIKTFASASDAAVTVQLTEKLTDSISCSYFIEATCDAPYVQYKADPASWPTAGADLDYSVVEYNGVTTSAANATPDDATAKLIVPETGPASVAGLTKGPWGDIKKIPKWPAATALKGANGKQGLDDADFAKVTSYPKGSQSGIDHSAYFLLKFISAKRAEYDAFNTAKTAYETKRTDYNTKLTAAEKITDAQKTDIFKAWFPTKEDTDAVKAVPTRPMKPELPSALPTDVEFAVKKAGTASDQVAGLVQKGAGDTAWEKVINLEVAGASDGDVVFAAGKSWGTNGHGMSDGKTGKANTKSGVNVASG